MHSLIRLTLKITCATPLISIPSRDSPAAIVAHPSRRRTRGPTGRPKFLALHGKQASRRRIREPCLGRRGATAALGRGTLAPAGKCEHRGSAKLTSGVRPRRERGGRRPRRSHLLGEAKVREAVGVGTDPRYATFVVDLGPS